MPHLVPVIEMMFGVTWYSLSFDVWCQAKLYKKQKVKKSKNKSTYCAHQRNVIISYHSYPAVCCSAPLCQQDFEIHPLQDARRCRDRSCLEEGSTVDLTPPAVMVPATVFVVMSAHSQIMWLQITNNFKNVMVILLRGAVTTSVHSSWPSVEQEVGLFHDQP